MIIVKSKPGPFEIPFLVASIIAGIAIFLNARKIVSTGTILVPQWTLYALAFGLIVGSSTALTGTFSEELWSLLLERAGLMLLGVLFVVYIVFTIDYSGIKALTSLDFFVMFSISCWWRVVQINRNLKIAKQMIQKGVHDAVKGQ